MEKRRYKKNVQTKIMRIMRPCMGYENGITTGKFTELVYGEDDIRNRMALKASIYNVRKNFPRFFVYNNGILGMKGSERRYYHLMIIL